MDDKGKAALAAIEVIIWQLVQANVLPSEPLAAELERYAGFSEQAARPLSMLALLTIANCGRPIYYTNCIYLVICSSKPCCPSSFNILRRWIADVEEGARNDQAVSLPTQSGIMNDKCNIRVPE